MIHPAPMPFAEALASHEARALMPTGLSSKELVERFGQAALNRALFAARLDNARDVQLISDLVKQILDGELDYATARERVQQQLDARGYTAPSPDEEDTITDLRSERRLNLILQTNVRMAQGYGAWVQGQDQAILDLWPAQELIRVEARKEHRDWPTTWRENGGASKMYGANPDYPGAGRMIARKDDAIWTDISRFDNPWPPFDFNSGMGLRNVPRKEAIALGVIDARTRIAPQRREFNEGLQSNVDDLDPDLRAELERDGYEVKGGDISLGPTGEYQG